MKISQRSIELVKDTADVVMTINRYIKLDSHNKASCPFHDEKSASFSVHKVDNYYNCFGCGKSGDSLQFVMDHEKVEFHEAIKIVAEINGITLFYDEETPEQARKFKQVKDKKEQCFDIMDKAAELFHAELLNNAAAVKFLTDRKISMASIIEWKLGFAPDSFSWLTDKFRESGKIPLGVDCSLLTDKDGKIFDFYRNRIVVPIRSKRGKIISFGGRALSSDHSMGKWKNGGATIIYDKSAVIFGLDKAARHISKLDKFAITEGYFDVIISHQIGHKYFVASSGTAFSQAQFDTLIKFTRNPLLGFDNDKAGIKATIKVIKLALAMNIIPNVIELDSFNDIDDLIQSKTDDGSTINEFQTEDAINWLSQSYFQNANSPIQKSNALVSLTEDLSLLENDYLQKQYVDSLHKDLNISKKIFINQLKEWSISNSDNDVKEDVKSFKDKLPSSVNFEDVINYNYYQIYENTNEATIGCYFATSGKNFTRQANFSIKPLFHIYSKTDNKRMIEITNEHNLTKILEVPSDAMISLDKFQKFVWDEGFYLFDGQKPHLQKINRHIGNSFPLCLELKKLGWKGSGFFAYADKIFDGEKVIDFDPYGIVKHKDHKYFSPSCSLIYKDVDSEDDSFEDDRYLNFKQSPISIEKWMELMIKVYGDNGKIGIVYAIATLFRDIIFKLDNNFPLLYLFGETRSGKSKCAESLSNLFYHPLKSFNLNSGTDFAFHHFLGKSANCIAFLNEFDDKVLKDTWFQSIKGSYDGEGRMRGKMGAKNKTEVQKVLSALVIVGQYLSNKDDNSITNRSILLNFKPNKNRTKDQEKVYNQLKAHESEGINSLLCDFIKHRDTLKPTYNKTFHEVFTDMKAYLLNKNEKFEERVNRNHCALLTIVKILGKKIGLPFTYEYFYTLIMDKIIYQTNILSQSDMLSEFWKVVSTLADGGDLIRGYHYKITVPATIKVKKKEKFINDKIRVLFIRMSQVHGMYSARYRTEQGKTAMNQESIINYFANRDYFIGIVDGQRFEGKNPKTHLLVKTSPTTAYAFDYDKMEKMGMYMDYFADDAANVQDVSEGSEEAPKENSSEFEDQLQLSKA